MGALGPRLVSVWVWPGLPQVVWAWPELARASNARAGAERRLVTRERSELPGARVGGEKCSTIRVPEAAISVVEVQGRSGKLVLVGSSPE